MLINDEDGFISCHHSSSESGHYYISIGNVTWRTHCRMKGIPGCGKGAWALVMRLNGSRVCCHQSLQNVDLKWDHIPLYCCVNADYRQHDAWLARRTLTCRNSIFLIATVLLLRTRSFMTRITGPAKPRLKKEQRSRLLDTGSAILQRYVSLWSFVVHLFIPRTQLYW